MHLSSSGKVKAYPVIARCGNLPVEIRNGDGIGGGRLVRWLPIVSKYLIGLDVIGCRTFDRFLRILEKAASSRGPI